eukprot:4212771-Amphidinium_carterae.1
MPEESKGKTAKGMPEESKGKGKTAKGMPDKGKGKGTKMEKGKGKSAKGKEKYGAGKSKMKASLAGFLPITLCLGHSRQSAGEQGKKGKQQPHTSPRL